MVDKGRTHYEVLGVGWKASTAEIKSAYSAAVRLVHPDHGGTPEAFRRVREAWIVLSDDRTRAEYDRKVAAPKARVESASVAAVARKFFSPGVGGWVPKTAPTPATKGPGIKVEQPCVVVPHVKFSPEKKGTRLPFFLQQLRMQSPGRAPAKVVVSIVSEEEKEEEEEEEEQSDTELDEDRLPPVKPKRKRGRPRKNRTVTEKKRKKRSKSFVVDDSDDEVYSP